MKESGIIGLSGKMNATVVGEKHECCIPVGALYKMDERYFVYIVKKREGVLGTELYAEKIEVNVLDQNSNYAAIEAGVLAGDSEVITSVTEEIARGDVVRHQE